MAASGQMTIWMRLRGVQATIAGLRQTAASTNLLGTHVQRLATRMETASRRTFLMNQALFTLRRYSYMATLALTAASVAVVKWGFDYNSQVQQASVALRMFLPSQKAVNDEISKLYNIAAYTPFMFTDITASARRFMAFGMTLKDTNRTIVNLTDVLSALGITTGAALNRASLALGHMMSLGRLTGQIVYQLARDNVPIIQALEKELGLTGDQLRHVGTLGISAGTALNALNTFVEGSKYHGAGLKLGLSTFHGILTTTKDYLAQFMGQVEKGWFDSLQMGTKRFVLWLQGAGTRGFKQGGVAGMIATVSPQAAGLWRLLAADLKAVGQIFWTSVVPAFLFASKVIGTVLYPYIYLLSKGLQFVSKHAWLTRLFFGLLAFEIGVMIARFIVLLPLQIAAGVALATYNAIQKIAIALGIAQNIVLKNQAGEIVFQKVVLTRLGTAMKLILTLRIKEGIALLAGTRLMRLWSVAAWGTVRASNGQFVAMTRLEKFVLRMRYAFLRLTTTMRIYAIAVWDATAAMVAFLFTNPIGWAILLGAALVLLYIKWKRFRDVVNDIFHIVIFGRGPFANALRSMFSPLLVAYNAALSLYGVLKAIRNLASGKTPGGHGWSWLGAGKGILQSLSPVPIPGLAGGGTVTGSGVFMVGEHGPEMLNLPRGSAVKPIGNTNEGMKGINLSGMVFEIHNRTVLEADGRQLAEVVSKHRLDASARR